jgi:hypothetical protein
MVTILSAFPRDNVVGTMHRVVRKAITQPAKPRRPSTPQGRRFAICQKCATSRARGAGSYIVRLFKSDKHRQSHAESERFSGPHNVRFSARRLPQTVLQPGNLYCFPTAARAFSQGHNLRPAILLVAVPVVPTRGLQLPFDIDFEPPDATARP